MDIPGWMTRIQGQLLDEVRSKLEDFHRELEVESELSSAFQVSGPAQYNPWDVKRTLRWTSSAGAALTGVAAVAGLIGGANFWNPVGWIAGAVSIFTLGLSWFFGDRDKKLQKQKAIAAQQLRDQIDGLERRVASQVKGWFYQDITRNLVRGIRTDTRALYTSMFRSARTLRWGASTLREDVEQANRRLILRTGAILKSQRMDHSLIGKVARDPGTRTKLLWHGAESPHLFCREVQTALNECMDPVLPGKMPQMVARSLRPARIDPSTVTVHGGRRAEVRAPQSEMGRAIGKAGHNVSLASQLLDVRIQIRSGCRE
jgi:hypothetical protein